MITELDQLLTHLGTGRWSILHFLALLHSNFLMVPHSLGAAFLAPGVDYTCRQPYPGASTSTSTLHPPGASTTTSTDTLLLQEQCGYRVNTTSGLVWDKCTDWHFDNTTYTTTVTSEFQLVCENKYLRTLYQSVYMFGVFFGSFLASFLCDRYGRKMVGMVGAITFTVSTIGSCWLPNLSALLVSRFLIGAINPILANSFFILAMELAEPRVRTQVGFASALLWAVGISAWAGLAYAIREWRLLQFVASLPALMLLPLLAFMDESPRWLMVQGRHQEALQVLRKAARWNRAPLPPEDELLQFMTEMVPSDEHKDSSKSTIKSLLLHYLREATVLFRTPKLRAITIVLYLDFVVLALVYYGLSLSGGSLSDDPFVYMALNGLVEVPAYTLTIPVVVRLGRRRPDVACFLICGAMLMLLAAIPTGYGWVVMTLALVGKVTISAAFQITIFYTNELYPTEVRSRGYGSAFMTSRIGSICSPFIIDFVGRTHPWAPSVVFGVASMVAGVATLTLPETKDCILPETVAHLEARRDKSSSPKCWLALKTRMTKVRLKSATASKEGNDMYDPMMAG